MNRSDGNKRSSFLYTSLVIRVQRMDMLFPTRSKREEYIKRGFEKERIFMLELSGFALISVSGKGYGK